MTGSIKFDQNLLITGDISVTGGSIFIDGVEVSSVSTSGGSFVEKSGDTMTGPLVINFDSNDTTASLQVNADGDARIRLNNPSGGESYSELAWANDGNDKYGWYLLDGGIFGLYDYDGDADRIEITPTLMQLNTTNSDSIISHDENDAETVLNQTGASINHRIETFFNTQAFVINSDDFTGAATNEYISVGLDTDTNAPTNGAFRVAGGVGIGKSLQVADSISINSLSLNENEIITVGSGGELVPSGTTIADLSGGFTPLEGDLISISSSGADFIFSHGTPVLLGGDSPLPGDGPAVLSGVTRDTFGHLLDFSAVRLGTMADESANDYTLLSITESISGDLQNQITTKQDTISLVEGSNVTILESPPNTFTISANVSGGSDITISSGNSISVVESPPDTFTINLEYSVLGGPVDSLVDPFDSVLNANLADIFVFRKTAGPNYVRGVTNGTAGRRITITNVIGVSTTTIRNDSASASVGDRIYTPTGADLTLGLNQTAVLLYIPDLNYWIVESTTV